MSGFSLGGLASSGDRVFLCQLLECDLFGLFNGSLLFNDSSLDGSLFGNHSSHSSVLLFEGFGEQLNFVGLGSGLLGESIDIFLFNGDSTGTLSLLRNLLFE